MCRENGNSCLPQNQPFSSGISPKVAGRRHRSHFRQAEGRQEPNMLTEVFPPFKLACWICTCGSYGFVLHVLLSENSVDTGHPMREQLLWMPHGRGWETATFPLAASSSPATVNCYSGSRKSTRKALQTSTDLCLFAPFLPSISAHLEAPPERQQQFLEETQS